MIGSKLIDDKTMQSLLQAGIDSTPLPKSLGLKTGEMIRTKIHYYPKRRFNFLPVLAPAFALLSLVIILPLKFRSNDSSNVVDNNRAAEMVVVSQSGGQLRRADTPLDFGYSIKEQDSIITATGEQVYIQNGLRTGLFLFSHSTLEFTNLEPESASIALTLQQGSLYIHKNQPPEAITRVAVKIEDYSFTLLGTRVYFSVDAEKTITVLCYDGRIVVKQKQNQPLCQLEKKEKLTIQPGGDWQIHAYETWCLPEQTLDAKLSSLVPFTLKIPEVDSPAPLTITSGEETNASSAQSRRQTTGSTASPGPTTSPDPTLPPYSVSSSGNIAPPGGGNSFYALLATGAKTFAINSHQLFILTENAPREIDIFPGTPDFRVSPIIAGPWLVLFSLNNIYLIKHASLDTVRTIPMVVEGIITDNYAPCYVNGKLYLPIRNRGYYTIDLDRGDFTLKKLYNEPFPLSPIVAEAEIYVGSYFDNYIAALDNSGKELWKYPLAGKSYTNLVKEKDLLYIYLQQGETHKILQLSTGGKLLAEGELPGKMVSDFIVANGTLYGVLSGGTFFAFDLTTTQKAARYTPLKRSFSAGLTTSLARNFKLGYTKGRIYSGTDSGEVVVYNIANKNFEPEVSLEAKGIFPFPPEFSKKGFLISSLKGHIFRVIENY